MKNINKTGFVNAILLVVYVSGVATLMQKGGTIFGEKPIMGPVGLLLLFTLSAIIVGTLVLGKPLMLYLDGQKKDAVRLFGGTVAWLATFTILTLFLTYLFKYPQF